MDSDRGREDAQTVLERLADDGVLQLPVGDLDDILIARGPLRGPVTDAGTRALAEQRGEHA